MTAKYPRALNISLAVLLAGTCYLVAGDLFFTPGVGIDEAAIAAGAGTQAAGRPGLEGYAVVLESGAFARPAVLALIDVDDSVHVKVSRAGQLRDSLMLVGTIVDKKGEGFAIFEKKDTGKQEVVKEGAMVSGAGVLSSIEKDKAHVKVDEETLTFTMVDIRAHASQTAYAPEITIPQPQHKAPRPSPTKAKGRPEDGRGRPNGNVPPHLQREIPPLVAPAPQGDVGEDVNPFAEIFSNAPEGEFGEGPGAMGAPFALPPD